MSSVPFIAQSPSCRVCGSRALTEFLRRNPAPASVERLLRQDDLGLDCSIELAVLRCADCGFLQQLASPLPPDYYRTYDKSAVHSPKMRSYQETLASELVHRFGLRGRTVLEAGGGDGYFAGELNRLGAAVTMVEPSRTGAAATRKLGIPVQNEYFSVAVGLPPASFDAFIARQVISHVEDLAKFVSGIVHFLKPGGVGIIEAPDVSAAIRSGRYFDFFADYVNYFSAPSLCALLARHGLEVREVTPRADGEYLLVVCERPLPVRADADLDRFLGLLRDIVAAERAAGRRLGCWGAGGRGVSILGQAGLGPQDIVYVIDVAPEKHGAFLPGSHLPVVAPEHLASDPVDTMIVTTMMFADEVVDDLRRRHGFGGRVVLLSPVPHLAGAAS